MKITDPRVDENLKEMCLALAQSSSQDLIEAFFHSLMTPAEIADIAGRWALVKALKQGMRQRDIAENLGLSLCKITRGSRELKKPDAPFLQMLQLLERK
ncbi:MAG: trp operon repressor [Treponema sp.]|jgi:TrpR family trp operon transcriptional repressor|nr:trp operon repressor [Treponema sp.]